MNDLMMSGGLSERIAMPSASGTSGIVVVHFSAEDKLSGRFKCIHSDSGLTIVLLVDEHDKPFKYFGLCSNKVIINTGSEVLSLSGEFKILKIENKTQNYELTIGAAAYERNIRNESL